MATVTGGLDAPAEEMVRGTVADGVIPWGTKTFT